MSGYRRGESEVVRRTFEFADHVYICWECESMQPSGDAPCPECGCDLFTWAGGLGRSDRFRVGSGMLPARAASPVKEEPK